MFNQDQITTWIIDSSEKPVTELKKTQFVEAARRAWLRNLIHAQREVAHERFNAADPSSLAVEIWETVLRSVWKTFCSEKSEIHIRNLTGYMIGAFQHRLSRYLKRTRCHNAVLEFFPTEKLLVLQTSDETSYGSMAKIHHKIQLEQVYAMLENDIRWAVVARTHGFTWQEVAKALGTDKQNLMMRVQYAIRKIRHKFDVMPQ